MYRFLYNDFYFNDRFLLVNSLELALRYIMAFTVICVLAHVHAYVNAMFVSRIRPWFIIECTCERTESSDFSITV